jgi:hypothetical protein
MPTTNVKEYCMTTPQSSAVDATRGLFMGGPSPVGDASCGRRLRPVADVALLPARYLQAGGHRVTTLVASDFAASREFWTEKRQICR